MSTQAAMAGQPLILVLGMHRSGTSALAGTLAELGVDFSTRLIDAAEDNPKGFFEHADIWQLDQDLLEGLGSQWDDPLPLPAGWSDSAIVADVVPKLRAIVQRDFGASPLAGIKDPRMCRLLPAWLPWLGTAGFAPRAVLVVRDPAEVMASLAKRDQLPAAQVAWIWLRHLLEAEAATRTLPRVVVRYAELLRGWRPEVARIADVLDLAWPVAPEAAAPAIDAFLEPTLRHGRGGGAAMDVPVRLQTWLDQVVAAFADDGGVDTAALDAVAGAMAEADALGASSGSVLRTARLRGIELQRTLQWCDDERRGLVAGNADLQENLERHSSELKAMQRGNAWLREEHERLGVQLARLDAERTRIAEELVKIYASHSWRITRPVRGLSRLARRLLGRPLPQQQVTPAAVQLSAPATAPVIAVASKPTVVVAPTAAVAALDAAFARATGPRVLIVTPDILGPIRNGGIGTAFAALAQTLAGAGRAVTILYTLGGHSEDGGDIARWTAHYAALGIRFIPTWLERGEPLLDAPHHAWRAYRVYLWLKQNQGDYDLAYFPEWKGEAYYALQAKRMGLDFAALRLVVVTHSSTTWADSGNHHLPQQFDDLLLEFLERRCVELADALVSPSQYMLDWMRERGWRWSAPAHVVQNLMPEAPAAADSAANGAADTAITEWVFFGRLERRKGLLVFLEALRQMPLAVREGVQITFLGKAIATSQFDSLATIRHRLGAWPRPLRLLTDYDRDQALAYLQQRGRVAVIASLVENSPYTVLECVLKRIPFIAADVGGIAELVHPEDRPRALFQPSPAALAASLLALEGKSYVPPRPAVSAALTRERWLALQAGLLAEVPVVAPVSDEVPWPTISVCLVHYDRQALLAQALDSLRRQTYAHFNVVLVDDGSPSAAAQAYLDSLGTEFAQRGWKLVRQANAYLGAARNAAARHADGDYVLFMDDDNLAKPDELAVFAAVARRTGADILTTVSDVFADTDNAGSPPPASRQLWIPLGNAQGLGVFRNVFGDANALVRRRSFLELGGFTEDYGLGHEDWEFFAKASLAGADLQLVPEPLFWYRVNAASMLRAGDSAADHARSVRPYWAGLPRGIGPVLAYASYLQRRPARGPAPLPGGIPRPSSLWRKLSGPFHASDRARFRELLRDGGWRATLTRGLRYIVRSRPRR